ncbi:YpdA family putative bacillithiol disulfide reductase [Bacillus solimangrovi]|uniref:Uncharacterized protein n=1 Tax=Bacillus solimangrovi TaxID=1305675 RepID=A0A1E5LHC2_9BACI|nr:YpdA family putative bacillithiol disulfide reductase [Bacillus solimangrovi]OEH93481.1 hypothetical protein BFG57_00355 [Bacillus solimangrovi]
MIQEDIIIIGGGPCGLSAAIELEREGFNPLVIEKGNIVNAVYNYPTHQTFFSSAEKLEIGDVPFVNEQHKPSRYQALNYYREVVKRKKVRVNAFEKVDKIEKQSDGTFLSFTTNQKNEETIYHSKYVVIATGYYDHPNMMNISGEELPHVFHYFKESHPYFDKDVVVIGGKNSAVDASIELHKAGARVTNLYRGSEYSKSVKPWILPEFDALVRNEQVNMQFRAEINEITNDEVIFTVDGEVKRVKAEFVFAMTGYIPDHNFLRKMDISIDEETGRPQFDSETMETNVEGAFIAGVIAAGNNANEIFIENGRFHGKLIAAELKGRK